MKVSGFSFVRNGEVLGYPFVESLHSLLPLCDEVIVAVGNSDDNTLKSVSSISNKIRIIETVWDDNKRSDGSILAEQTNIALSHCIGDWCIYLQGDEVFHEDDYDIIHNEMVQAQDNHSIDALLFRWYHFFGSYDYVGVGRQWYRREIRAFKNTGHVFSWRDAQGFRTKDSTGTIKKLNARQTEARVFHYGWVRHPRIQQKKQHAFQRLYHNDDWIRNNIPDKDEFDYSCYEVAPYSGTHPSVMQRRIGDDRVWTQHFDPSKTKKRPILVSITDAFEKLSGYRIGEYKNFIEVQ